MAKKNERKVESKVGVSAGLNLSRVKLHKNTTANCVGSWVRPPPSVGSFLLLDKVA